MVLREPNTRLPLHQIVRFRLIHDKTCSAGLTLLRMKELSVGEQRYQAVMAVLSGGRTVTEVARDWEVSRQAMHAWPARYGFEDGFDPKARHGAPLSP